MGRNRWPSTSQGLQGPSALLYPLSQQAHAHFFFIRRLGPSIYRSPQSLGWESLQHRRYIDRLSMLFRFQHGLVDVTTDYIQLNDTRTRGSQRLCQL